jgi:deoxyribodipyrimidine photolyase-related protein
MKKIRMLYNDQLSKSMSSLEGIDKKNDLVFLCESIEGFTNVKHHKKKIAFIVSCMRHFSEELKESNFNIVHKQVRLNC